MNFDNFNFSNTYFKDIRIIDCSFRKSIFFGTNFDVKEIYRIDFSKSHFANIKKNSSHAVGNYKNTFDKSIFYDKNSEICIKGIFNMPINK